MSSREGTREQGGSYGNSEKVTEIGKQEGRSQASRNGEKDYQQGGSAGQSGKFAHHELAARSLLSWGNNSSFWPAVQNGGFFVFGRVVMWTKKGRRQDPLAKSGTRAPSLEGSAVGLRPGERKGRAVEEQLVG